MAAQSARLRVVAENIANRDSTGQTPGAEPYRRKTITFDNRLDRAVGARMAERIREAAREAGVPLLPNPPLARALWKLDVDTEIPPEHWEAVAEIIAFVMRPRGAQAPP